MSSANTSKAGSRADFLKHAWWVVLVGAICLTWYATERRIARVEKMTNSPTWSGDAPHRDSTTATGYEHGQRALIVPGHHNPSFWWIMEAQQSAAEGKLRLRRITYDAPVEGRDIKRTSPYRWWLISVGWVRSTLLGESLGYAIERGALVADPLLLVIMIMGGAIYVARFVGPMAAIVFAVGGASLFPLAGNFQPGAPDAHSLAWVLAVGSVLPLIVASQEAGKGRACHFLAAGIIGGVGFWNDAASQAPVLFAIFLGGLCREFMRSRGVVDKAASPLEWRTWAVAGGVTTLVASLFEFAPGHLTLSLDAVSPIHAVAWWGAGEVLRGAGISFRDGRAGMSRRTMFVFGAGLVACAAWPAIALIKGSGTLLAQDFYANELANHPRGSIAPSFGIWLGRGSDNGAIFATLLPCAILVFVGARVWMGRLSSEERARLLFVGVAAGAAVVLACIQLRWWNLADALLLPAAACLFPSNRASRFAGRFCAAGVIAVMLPGLIVGIPTPAGEKEAGTLGPIENQELIARDYSYWIARRSGPEPVVLFSMPIFSSAAAFFGGFPVIASSDDQNRNGSLAAVRIAGATTEQELSVLLHSRGVTHLAFPLWDPALDQFVRVALNVPSGQPLPEKAFAVSLRLWDVPVWMRVMDYLIPNEEQYRGFDLRTFRIGASQEPDMALSRLVDFFLDRGQVREAAAVRDSLKKYPRSVVARGAIARIDVALRDRDAIEKDLEDLIPEMSRRAARDLPADRRISLGTLFFQTNHRDLAREQLEKALQALDVQTLRSFTPGTTINLLGLSRALGLSLPSQQMKDEALSLIPPVVRKSLGGG